MIIYLFIKFHNCNDRYNLAHVTNGACSGPLPTVEFSLRSSIDGDDNIPQEFTEWSLVQYYTGKKNCMML